MESTVLTPVRYALCLRRGRMEVHTNMARYLYSALSSLVQARANCITDATGCNPNAVTAAMPMDQNAYHVRMNWADNHQSAANELVRDRLPSGSGFDAGTKLDWERSHADKLVFTTSFHHMNENGYYDGWTEHTVIVTPSLSSHFHLRITGRNRNDIKEHIADQFQHALLTLIAEVV